MYKNRHVNFKYRVEIECFIPKVCPNCLQTYRYLFMKNCGFTGLRGLMDFIRLGGLRKNFCQDCIADLMFSVPLQKFTVLFVSLFTPIFLLKMF